MSEALDTSALEITNNRKEALKCYLQQNAWHKLLMKLGEVCFGSWLWRFDFKIRQCL